MAGIKPLELEPIQEHIYDTLIRDAVGRNKNLWQFACFCSAQEGRCSIALDAGWGMGKTFFLKQLEMLFNHSNLKKEDQDKIEKAFASFENSDKNLKVLKPHVCVYYDAWLNDNAKDSMRSILYELLKQTKKRFVKNGIKDWAKTFCGVVDSFTGKDTSSLVDLIENTNHVREIEEQKSFHSSFNSFLRKLVPKQNERLLVLIDELDRCNPTYAVQLLERIKHYLSNEKTTFVFAINEDQLLNTLKVFYGEEFDAYQYLDRFFDYRLSLPKPDMDKFNKHYGFNQSDERTKFYSLVCDTFIQKYALSLRESTKYRQWVKIVCGSFINQCKEYEDNSWKVVMFFIIPIALGLKIKNRIQYSSFMNGKQTDSNSLHIVLNGCRPLERFFYFPADQNIYNTSTTFTWRQAHEALGRVDAIYKALFVTPIPEKGTIDLYGFSFTRKMVEIIHQSPSLMDDFITYDIDTETPIKDK